MAKRDNATKISLKQGGLLRRTVNKFFNIFNVLHFIMKLYQKSVKYRNSELNSHAIFDEYRRAPILHDGPNSTEF